MSHSVKSQAVGWVRLGWVGSGVGLGFQMVFKSLNYRWGGGIAGTPGLSTTGLSSPQALLSLRLLSSLISERVRAGRLRLWSALVKVKQTIFTGFGLQVTRLCDNNVTVQ